MAQAVLGVQISSPHGEVDHKMKEYARQKIARAVRGVRDPVLSIRVTLRMESDPARPRPAVARAAVDVNGRKVRASESGTDLQQAIDLLEDTLRRNLEHLLERQQTRRRRSPERRPAHEWRHGDPPTPRRNWVELPRDERQIIRRTTLAGAALLVADAVAQMDQLGYDFHLFVSAETGAPCVLVRHDDGRLTLRSSGPPPSVGDALDIDPTPVPAMHEREAVDLLDLSGRRLVAFRPDGERTAVLYHRDDGHYGLVTASRG